jgi:hypothetical protein
MSTPRRTLPAVPAASQPLGTSTPLAGSLNMDSGADSPRLDALLVARSAGSEGAGNTG